MNDTILPGKLTELDNLRSTFFKSYPETTDGQRHIALYESGRNTGASHYEQLDASAEVKNSHIHVALALAVVLRSVRAGK